MLQLSLFCGPYPTTCFSFLCRSSLSSSNHRRRGSPASLLHPSAMPARCCTISLSARPRRDASLESITPCQGMEGQVGTWTARLDCDQGWVRETTSGGRRSERCDWLGPAQWELGPMSRTRGSGSQRSETGRATMGRKREEKERIKNMWLPCIGILLMICRSISPVILKRHHW